MNIDMNVMFDKYENIIDSRFMEFGFGDNRFNFVNYF